MLRGKIQFKAGSSPSVLVGQTCWSNRFQDSGGGGGGHASTVYLHQVEVVPLQLVLLAVKNLDILFFCAQFHTFLGKPPYLIISPVYPPLISFIWDVHQSNMHSDFMSEK